MLILHTKTAIESQNNVLLAASVAFTNAEVRQNEE